MKVSVVFTVFNEEASIEPLLASLAAQTHAPDEVVVVDGGSSDRTLERLRTWEHRLPLKIRQAPGSNISQGRNRAIEGAEGPIIAVTDAGVRLHPPWLEALLRPFAAWEASGRPGLPPVACGFFLVDPRSLFEVALGAVTLPMLQEIDSQRFLPSSRSVAFAKEAWQAGGGYPEWLDYSEDLVLDFRLCEAGYPFVWVPEALVSFRPRSTLAAFFRQYYRYGRGDGKANLWPLRHAARYSAYALGLLLAVAGLKALLFWIPLALAGLAYLARPALRLARQRRELSWRRGALALLLLPLLRATGDLAKMLGYPAGVWWRWRRRAGRGWRAGP